MKTIKIYERDVTERTGYRKYPYKTVRQYHILYDGQDISNCNVKLNDTKLRIKFVCTLNTRNKQEVQSKINRLGRCQEDQWLKANLTEILKRL